MALELQLSTQQAIAQLTAAKDAITQFSNAASGLSRAATAIDQLAKALNEVKPINSSVVSSINAIVQATGALAGATANVERFNQALSGLGRGVGTEAVTNINNIASAAERLGQNDGAGKLKEELQGVQTAASQAVQPITSVAEATEKIKAPEDFAAPIKEGGEAAAQAKGSVSELGESLGQSSNYTREFSENVEKARGSTQSFAGGLDSIKQALSAIGISATIAGLTKFAEGCVDASNKVQALVLKIDSVTKTVGTGADAFDHLTQTTQRLAIPIGGVIDSYGRLVAAMVASGHSVGDAEKLFDDFSAGLKGFGATADGTNRVFYALTEVMEKGTVSLQQLGRQMSNVFPATEELAKALGVSVTQLRAMITAGQVGSATMEKLAKTFKNDFGPAAEQAAETGAGALNRIKSAVFELQAVVGHDILESFKNSLNELADILNDINFRNLISGLTQVGDLIGGVLLGGLKFVIDSFGNFATVVEACLDPIKRLYNAITDNVGSLGPFGDILKFVGSALGDVGKIIGTAVAGFISLGIAAKGISAAFNGFSELMRGVGEAVEGTGKIVEGAKDAWKALSDVVSAVGIKWVAIGAAALILGIAIGSLIKSLINGKSPAENFKQTISDVGDVITSAAGHFTGLITNNLSLGKAYEGVVKPADDAKKAIAGANDAAGGYGGSSNGYTAMNDNLKQASEYFLKVASPAKTAGAAMVTAANDAKTAAAGMNGLGQAATTAAADQQKLTTSSDKQGYSVRSLAEQWEKFKSDMTWLGEKFPILKSAVEQVNVQIQVAQEYWKNFKQAISDAANYMKQFLPSIEQVKQALIGWKNYVDESLSSLMDLGKYLASFLPSMEQVKNAFLSWKEYVDESIQSLKDFGEYLGTLGNNISEWVNQTEGDVHQWYDNIANYLGSKADDIINGVKKAFNSLSSTITNVFNSAKGELQAWKDWFNSWINAIENWINNAITKLEKLIGLKGQAGDGGGGPAATNAPSSYYGGITGASGIGGGRSFPSSSFVGAPHFATGGITSGDAGGGTGIPSILHPNEAVIPLQGGAVPVTFIGAAGGGGGGGDSGQYAQQMYDLQVEIKEEIIKAGQTLVDTFTFNQGEFPKFETLLGQVSVGLSQVVSAIAAIALSSASSGGGGGSSSGGSSSGGSSGGTSPTDAKSAYATLQQAMSGNNATLQQTPGEEATQATIEQIKSANWFLGFDGVAAGNVGALQDQADAEYQTRTGAASAANQQLINAYVAQYGLAAYKKLSGSGGPGGAASTGGLNPIIPASSYADGTPNTSLAGGGMHAVVHPNEAVIPLPDGRSVPVTLPTDMQTMLQTANRAAQQILNGGGGFNGGPSNGGQTNVSMVINTPDAGSFKKSQQQILSDLRSNINRAKDVSASSKRTTEDPTKTARTVRI